MIEEEDVGVGGESVKRSRGGALDQLWTATPSNNDDKKIMRKLSTMEPFCSFWVMLETPDGETKNKSIEWPIATA